MALNKELLLKVRDTIRLVNRRKRGPKWNQGSWRQFNPSAEVNNADHRCQTAMCFAGWTAELSDDTDWVYSAVWLAEHDKEMSRVYDLIDSGIVNSWEAQEAYEWFRVDADTDIVFAPKEMVNDDYYGQHCFMIHSGPSKDRMAVAVGTYAQWKLGLGQSQRQGLFDGGNDMKDIDKVINQILAEQ